jgi:hypothetical protein
MCHATRAAGRRCRLPAVGGTGLQAGASGCFLRRPRQTASHAAWSEGERPQVPLQSLVVATHPIAFDLRAPQVFFEPLNATRLVVDDLLSVTRRRILRAAKFAPVMPDSRPQYKREMRVSSVPTRQTGPRVPCSLATRICWPTTCFGGSPSDRLGHESSARLWRRHLDFVHCRRSQEAIRSGQPELPMEASAITPLPREAN